MAPMDMPVNEGEQWTYLPGPSSGSGLGPSWTVIGLSILVIRILSPSLLPVAGVVSTMITLGWYVPAGIGTALDS